jgi:hypothetical protein
MIRMKAIATVMFFMLLLSMAHAESIGGVTLGQSLSSALSRWGEPESQKTLASGEKECVWTKEKEVKITVLAKNDKITYMRCATGIGCKKEYPAYSTLKGICIGGSGKSITTKYGRGKNDYAYPTEDCLIINYPLSSAEMLVFRAYGFNKRGIVVIDIVLCEPSYPRDSLWKTGGR